ncbi:hypothetical protein C9374_011593 [Naegleria lovaniensis]|uniref:Uncharacterized protein n=1 Tax=Naegleria lovaniensis TaxID=51637 RepID=A0AA88GEX4_NAELO|nr:uncharacterized protein C9374_011593 [Naegleria lovaniensis]KAG2373928.1 hypothetical protein C9374_011593 [Naegleria lovaniensis]
MPLQHTSLKNVKPFDYMHTRFCLLLMVVFIILISITTTTVVLGDSPIHNNTSESEGAPTSFTPSINDHTSRHERPIPKVIMRTKEEHQRHNQRRTTQTSSSSTTFTQPHSKFIQWHHCYSADEEDLESGISLITAHLTIVPTRYNVPGVRVDMDMKFNMPIPNTNMLFYQFELWHEETGQTIKYKGPYDVCCGNFIHPHEKSRSHGHDDDDKDEKEQNSSGERVDSSQNSSSNNNNNNNNEEIKNHPLSKNHHLEFGCSLEESHCPIVNLNKTYHAQIERPLYVTEKGTYEASVKIYKHRQLESDPSRTEKYEYLCVDIPFKVNFEKEMLNTALWKQTSPNEGDLALTTSSSSTSIDKHPVIKDEM